MMSIEGSEEGIGINSDMGSTTADTLLNAEAWGVVTETKSLHFSLSGTFMSGENFEYSLLIEVKEVASL